MKIVLTVGRIQKVNGRQIWIYWKGNRKLLEERGF